MRQWSMRFTIKPTAGLMNRLSTATLLAKISAGFQASF
jgi:hypothetical protein